MAFGASYRPARVRGLYGDAISTFRHQLRLTQEQLAHEMGVTASTINRWENGHARPTRLAQRALRECAQRHGATFGA